MYVQYSEGLPGVVIDDKARQIYIDTNKDSYQKDLEAAYERYLADDLDYFAISEGYAAGLYEFIRLRSSMSGCRYVKGQIIGPISFGLTVSDQNKKAVIYNREFRDCLLKCLAMKAAWQISRLKTSFPSAKIIIFIDEPYLVSLGSSYFNIKPEEVISMLNEIIASIHKEGAVAGIHCCGNTDWPVILKTDIDILSFDAYNYLKNLFIYKEDLDDFKKRSGVFCWGIVPTESDREPPTLEALMEKMDRQLDGYGLVTPSCGLSGVPLRRAEEVLDLSSRLAKTLAGR